GEVVALVADRAVLGAELAVVGDVGGLGIGEHDHRGVEGDIDGAVAAHAAAAHRIPAQTHLDEGERGTALLAQGDPLALLQADRTVLAQADLALRLRGRRRNRSTGRRVTGTRTRRRRITATLRRVRGGRRRRGRIT